MRRLIAGITVALLLAGAGCGSGRPVIATADMMPTDFTIMPGLTPSDPQSWRRFGTKDKPLIDTHWRTTALFDKVEAYYLDFFGKSWGFATSTVGDKEKVWIYWGLYADIKAPAGGSAGRQYMAITKAQTDGMTDVEIVIEPRYQ